MHTGVKYTGSVLPAENETVTLFNSVTAFPGKDFLQYGNIRRAILSLEHSHDVTLKAYKSSNRVTWHQVEELVVAAPAASATTTFDFYIGAFGDWKLEAVNGATAQTLWSPSLTLDHQPPAVGFRVTIPAATLDAIYVGHEATFRGSCPSGTTVAIYDGEDKLADATVVGSTWSAAITEAAEREHAGRTYTATATFASGLTEDIEVVVAVESKVQGHVANICARYANKIERCCTPETASYLIDGEDVTRWYDTSRKGIVLTDGIRTTAGTLNNKHFSQDTDANQPTTATVSGDVVLTNRDTDEFMTGSGLVGASAAWTSVVQCSEAAWATAGAIISEDNGAGGFPWWLYTASSTVLGLYVRNPTNASETRAHSFGRIPGTQNMTATRYVASDFFGRFNGGGGGSLSGTLPTAGSLQVATTTYLFRRSTVKVDADATIGLVLWASEAIAAAELETDGWLDTELKAMLGTY